MNRLAYTPDFQFLQIDNAVFAEHFRCTPMTKFSLYEMIFFEKPFIPVEPHYVLTFTATRSARIIKQAWKRFLQRRRLKYCCLWLHRFHPNGDLKPLMRNISYFM